MPELSKTCSNLIFAFSTNFLAYCTNFLNRGQQTTALVPILPTTCFVFFLTFWGGVFIYLFIYFWLCWVFVSVRGLSLVVASGGHSSSRCAGLSLSRPLLLPGTGSRRSGSVIVAHGPSCSVACGIFPDQDSNPCPLHWQADSQPLRHQGSPTTCFCTVHQIRIVFTLLNVCGKKRKSGVSVTHDSYTKFKLPCP